RTARGKIDRGDRNIDCLTQHPGRPQLRPLRADWCRRSDAPKSSLCCKVCLRVVAVGCYAPVGPAHDAYLAAGAASTKELIVAIVLEAGHAHTVRQVEGFQHVARCRIQAAQFVVVAIPGGMPE